MELIPVALTAEDLRRTLDPADVPFDSSAEVEPLDGMMSQPRAGVALELALDIDAPGYNLFATGPAGTGKRSVLEAELRRRTAARPSRTMLNGHGSQRPAMKVSDLRHEVTLARRRGMRIRRGTVAACGG